MDNLSNPAFGLSSINLVALGGAIYYFKKENNCLHEEIKRVDSECKKVVGGLRQTVPDIEKSFRFLSERIDKQQMYMKDIEEKLDLILEGMSKAHIKLPKKVKRSSRSEKEDIKFKTEDESYLRNRIVFSSSNDVSDAEEPKLEMEDDDIFAAIQAANRCG